MKVYPAIDIMSGEAVRLTKGDFDTKEVFANDPAAVAKRFAEEGATHLHLVDLDGARHGSTENFDTIRRILGCTGMFTEVGGGIRDKKRIEQYIECGVSRVILGTAALADRAFLAEALRAYGDKIAVGVDALGGMVATHGWETLSTYPAFDFVRDLRDMGVATVIFTDISRDGGMQGTNIDAYSVLSQISGIQIIASGGVSDTSEITALREMGIHGVILGKALYKGLMTLTDALRAAEGSL